MEGTRHLQSLTQWQMKKDCLAFGFADYRENGGRYVQSDMQFAQLVQDMIRVTEELTSDEKIADSINLDLTYFFQKKPRQDDKVESAMMQLTWSNDARNLLDSIGEKNYEDLEGPDMIQSQIHGYDYQDEMYRQAQSVSLKNKVVSAFYFDKTERFAGIQTIDIHNAAVSSLTFTEGDKLTTRALIPSEWTNSLPHLQKFYDGTRLVGFRSEKACDRANDILSVTPIYYSIDEDMCSDPQMRAVTDGMLEEIPAYGVTCEELFTQSTLRQIEHVVKNHSSDDLVST